MRQSSTLLADNLVGDADAFSLNGLDEESRDRARSECFFQCGEIVEGHLDAIGQKRAEAVAEFLVAVQRQRPVGQAVKGVTAIDDAVATGAAREI